MRCICKLLELWHNRVNINRIHMVLDGGRQSFNPSPQESEGAKRVRRLNEEKRARDAAREEAAADRKAAIPSFW